MTTATWRWVMAVVVLAGALAGLAYHGGVTVERRRQAEARQTILERDAARERELAARQAELEAEVRARGQLVEQALQEIRAAEARAEAAAGETDRALAKLAQAATREDSLAAYGALVPGLQQQLVLEQSSTQRYHAALAESLAKSATLTAQLGEKNALLASKDSTIAALRGPPPAIDVRTGGLGRAVETIAIASVTIRACEASVLSFGCLMGTALSVNRLR